MLQKKLTLHILFVVRFWLSFPQILSVEAAILHGIAKCIRHFFIFYWPTSKMRRKIHFTRYIKKSDFFLQHPLLMYLNLKWGIKGVYLQGFYRTATIFFFSFRVFLTSILRNSLCLVSGSISGLSSFCLLKYFQRLLNRLLPKL